MNAQPSSTDLESVACYVCGSSDSSRWAEENGFQAVRCGSCGLVYVTPRPTRASISLAAQSGLHEGQMTTDETGARAPGKVKGYRQRLRALYGAGGLTDKRGARWLDIGCGFGEFLEALQLESAGSLLTCGSEPNERKASAARSRDLDVTFRDLACETTTYDFVSLLNVFSHLPHPPELLQQLRSRMRPGGEIVLQTGNWAELERDAIPDRLHLPDHLSFGSEAIVRRLFEASGFSVVSVLRYPMFRPSLWARLGGKSASAAGACDLWFRARLTAS
jgi:SAM-dependent methyltransferase